MWIPTVHARRQAVVWISCLRGDRADMDTEVARRTAVCISVLFPGVAAHVLSGSGSSMKSTPSV